MKPIDSIAPGVPAQRSVARALWSSVVTFSGWAALTAIAMSTQLLVQPFVWRNWPWDEVVTAWLGLAYERLVVALIIAWTIALVWQLPLRSPLPRSLVLGVAIVFGATVGEHMLAVTGFVDPPGDVREVLSRAGQWSMLSASLASLFYLWRRAGALQSEAQDVALRRVENERRIAQARLQALRSQIEPHFLFNTLAPYGGFTIPNRNKAPGC